jgi:hypothetical protein
MAFHKWFGPLVVSGVMGLVAYGCSSSSSSGTPPGSGDAGQEGGGSHLMLEAGSGDDSEAGATYDGTTGKACTSDKDCITATGPGINICSSSVAATYTNVQANPWPTPVCIPPLTSTGGNCDPAPAGQPAGIHFCDGPDDPSSPGFCAAFDNPPQTGRGYCYPKCTFKIDGSMPQGCLGFDTCLPQELEQDPSTLAVTGYGFCWGTCQKDSDCSALGTGFSCETDIGFCTQAPLARTKALGVSCSSDPTGTDSTAGTCNCQGDITTNLGYCSSVCVVGGTPCPDGWICDGSQSTSLDFGTGTPVPVTMQDVGFPGTCRPACTLADAGAIVDSGASVVAESGTLSEGGAGAGDEAGADTGAAATASCPPNSTCQALFVVGPDCIP